MGIQVGSSLEPPRSSFAQQYGPWHYHDVRSSRYGWGEGAALISNAFSERFAGAEGNVDGHNTAPLPCKKRRLRLHLVTSRLSRPFSVPATHVLNRESILKGDKRLRSIAAAANKRMAMAGWGMGAAGQNGNGGGGGMTAMGGNGSAAWLRKMAVMNRFRMRMLGENLARAQQAAAHVAQIQAQVQGVGQGEMTGGGNTGGVPMQRSGTGQQPQAYGPGTSSRLAPGQAGRQQVPAPVTGFPPPVIHTNTATSSGSSEPSAPPQRLSPDLRLIEDQDLDDDEDVAFPTSAHESRYEGEEEEEGHEVYADFGVLFGGGGGDDLDDEEGNSMSGEMPVKEQQESLGGIPWGAT
ncbi:hypothetical protein N0V85_003049 [Neurospora sp. IMI 360204]|nr:hypothetical protein N0V85_003049 [Neurospora sp. IMI 360204]